MRWMPWRGGCHGRYIWRATSARRKEPPPHLRPPYRPLGHLGEEALAGWFTRASIYALPARYEPFGLSVVEAAKSGCALVLGDIETLRELWGEAALFADPSEEDALFDATMRLIRDGAFRRRMGARALRHAGRYRTDVMVASYVSAYRRARVLHERAAAAAIRRRPDCDECPATGTEGLR